MKKILFCVGLFFCLCAGPAIAQPISSSTLIKEAFSYDNKTILYEGEVIGDIMYRGDFAWVNVHDGNAAIGVWMPKAFAHKIQYTGGYQIRGDWLRIEGVFHRACPEHGAELDIHARVVERIKSGEKLSEPLDKNKANAVIILIALLCLILILNIFRKR